MNKNLYVILMAGGAGTRFWPYSRNAKPKQFLDVLGTGSSLLQSTYNRFKSLCPTENIYVITSREYVELTQQQIPELKSNQIIGEPMRRNTAPCIIYAAKKISAINPNAVMVVAPSDHIIINEKEFRKVIRSVTKPDVINDKLVTLGIKPSRPETGYGYIQFIESKDLVKKVKTFTEKPELSLAKKFIDSKDFVWNAGIFIWTVEAILDAAKKYIPETLEIFEEHENDLNSEQENSIIEIIYSQIRNISVDYGILEKADNVYVCMCDFAWSDLGSWTSLFEHSKRDKANNSVEANAIVYDSRNCIIRGPKDKILVVHGLNDYLVGVFDNAVVVCQKDKEDLFRRMVNDLKGIPGGENFL